VVVREIRGFEAHGLKPVLTVQCQGTAVQTLGAARRLLNRRPLQLRAFQPRSCPR